MRTLLVFISIFLRAVVPLSTGPNIASQLSVKDQVLARRCAMRTAIRYDKVLSKSVKDEVLERNEEAKRALQQRFLHHNLVQAANNYEQILEIPVSVMIDYALSYRDNLGKMEHMWSCLQQEWMFINRGKDLFLREIQHPTSV